MQEGHLLVRLQSVRKEINSANLHRKAETGLNAQSSAAGADVRLTLTCCPGGGVQQQTDRDRRTEGQTWRRTCRYANVAAAAISSSTVTPPGSGGQPEDFSHFHRQPSIFHTTGNWTLSSVIGLCGPRSPSLCGKSNAVLSVMSRITVVCDAEPAALLKALIHTAVLCLLFSCRAGIHCMMRVTK